VNFLDDETGATLRDLAKTVQRMDEIYREGRAHKELTAKEMPAQMHDELLEMRLSFKKAADMLDAVYEFWDDEA
jgi:hypothetical protein